jgi:pimeloyl-ACP methyl ester carboxylesterase
MARSGPAPGKVDAGTVYRRGFAPSPPPRRGHSDFDEDAADIVSLIEHRPHVVAHSYGGVGAILAAARAPQRVRSLTLIEPPVHLVEDDPEAEHFKQIGEAFLAGGADTDPEIMREFLKIAGSPLPDHGPCPTTFSQLHTALRAHDRRMRPASSSNAPRLAPSNTGGLRRALRTNRAKHGCARACPRRRADDRARRRTLRCRSRRIRRRPRLIFSPA